MSEIETLKQENRIFEPSAEFVSNATISGGAIIKLNQS